MENKRKIIFYRNYFSDFYSKQTTRVKEKIDFVLYLISIADRIPVKFLKHVEGTNGLYEIRIELAGNIYRIFCCFDKGNVVILFNGFQKKSEKAPKEEIEKALRLMSEYFKQQKKD